MPVCARKGCGKQFDEGSSQLCTFHPGAPVFHEGLKSWSCCSDTNKPVLDFDEFMRVPGCTEIDGHSSSAPVPPVVSKSSVSEVPTSELPSVTQTEDGKEVFTGSSVSQAARIVASAAPPPQVPEDEDDLSVPIEPGTACKRRGCNTTFISEEVSRRGDGEAAICVYHPMPPIFREGSKGYLCCKPKVLEFDEFLKIRGCKKGRHCFFPKAMEAKTEELVECRIDHYQTLDKVQVSVFAKKVDKEYSTVHFEDEKVTVDLRLPDRKRFVRTLTLFGPIDPAKSSFTILGTKVELSLQKKDGRSWAVLEKTDRDLGGLSLTFGVSGRTGTVGGKEIFLDESNRARSVGI